MQFQHFIVVWHTLQVTEPAQSTLRQGDCDEVLFSLLSNSAVSYMVIILTFSSRRRQLMSKAMNRLQSRMVMFHVSEPYSNTEETRARNILSFVCREMQRRFHNALESLFMAPAALLIREVISASMEPSAETIQPRYVNEGTNSTSSPSMFIGVAIAEDGEIIMALVLVQLIDIPKLATSAQYR